MSREKYIYVNSVNLNTALVSEAPHGATVRATYTADVNKIAIVKYITLSVLRTSAPTTVGRSRIWIVFSPTSGSPINFGEARIYSTAVGASDRIALSVDFRLMPYEQLTIYTQDASTGGTCDYNAEVLIQEI